MKILITGAGSEGAYGVIKCIKEHMGGSAYILGLDTNNNIANKKFLNKFIMSIPRESKGYIDFINEILIKEQIDVFWPIPTEELDIFCEKLEEIKCKMIICNKYESNKIANNKKCLYEYFSSFDFIPKFKVIHNYIEMEESIQEFGYPEKKVCIKKTKGSGARGFRILDYNYNLFDSIMNEYPNNVVTTWEAIKESFKAYRGIPEIMIMEYLPGEEFDVDVLSFEGRVYYCIPRLNEKMYFGMSLITIPTEEAELIKRSTEIVETLKLSYINSLTFKKDVYGRYKLIEINPRVPGSIISARYAGINYPGLALELAKGNEINQNHAIIYGQRVVRYWEDTYID